MTYACHMHDVFMPFTWCVRVICMTCACHMHDVYMSYAWRVHVMCMSPERVLCMTCTVYACQLQVTGADNIYACHMRVMWRLIAAQHEYVVRVNIRYIRFLFTYVMLMSRGTYAARVCDTRSQQVIKWRICHKYENSFDFIAVIATINSYWL